MPKPKPPWPPGPNFRRMRRNPIPSRSLPWSWLQRALQPCPSDEERGSKRKEAPNVRGGGSARGAPFKRNKEKEDGETWGCRPESLDALRARGAEPLSKNQAERHALVPIPSREGWTPDGRDLYRARFTTARSRHETWRDAPSRL